MNLWIKIGLLFFGLGIWAEAQIYANFRTSEGDFTALLDHVEAPLAVANFVTLAGKADDVLETASGVPLLTDPNHSRHFYRSAFGVDSPRLPLTVVYIPPTDTMRGFYGIYQSQTYIGGVETFQLANYYADITGRDRIRLSLVSGNPVRYRITMRYPRPWLDARTQTVKDAPMYRNLVINRVETGKRFFAGSMTRNRLEHPGYHFQDELLKVPGNTVNPFGTPFSTAGKLAMDTVGKNQNGSRFFVTSAADPSWNGKYTPFGVILTNLGGFGVVQSIANTATTGDQEPNNLMLINSIEIVRVGNSAAAFFETYHQSFLPGEIEELCLKIERTGSDYSLVSPLRPSSQAIFYESFDLKTFTGGFVQGQAPNAVTPLATDLTNTVNLFPKLFVKGFATDIEHWPSADVEMKGAEFSFGVRSGVDTGSLSLFMDESGTVGTYTIDMRIEQAAEGGGTEFLSSVGSGTFAVTYDFSSGPYKGVMNFSNVTGPLNVDEITLHLDSTRYANNPLVTEGAIVRRFDAFMRNEAGIIIFNYDGIYRKLQ